MTCTTVTASVCSGSQSRWPEKSSQALKDQTTESLLSMIYKLQFQRDLQSLVSINVKFENFYLNLVRISLKKVRSSMAVRISSFKISISFLLESKHRSSRLGLDGYLEGRNGQELSPGQEFSVFEGDDGLTRLMLGPASFINHSCEPNVKFECGGATKLIVRVYPLRDIYAREELLVNYSSSFFSGRTMRIAFVLFVILKDWLPLKWLLTKLFLLWITKHFPNFSPTQCSTNSSPLRLWIT